MNRIEGKKDHGWGFEIAWANKDKYCGKLLIFNNPGAKTSMHFHKEREKSWLHTYYASFNSASTYSYES